MEKRTNRPARPLTERRQYFDSQNRPVPNRRNPREDQGRDEAPRFERSRADDGRTDEQFGEPRRRDEERPEGRRDEGSYREGSNREEGRRPSSSTSSDKPRYPHRPAQDRSIDMIFGLRPILEALSAGRTLDKIFLLRATKNSMTQDINALAREANVPVSMVPVEKLDNITRKNHQGAVAFVSPIDYMPLDNILAGLYEEGKTPLLLVLDRITDVRNFGSIARNAECLGVHAIVVPSHGAAQINGDALKTSAGALNLIPVCREHNLKQTLTFLRESGVQVVACTEKSDASLEAETVDLTGPLAILMGSEEDGISPEYLRLADHKLRIPMAGQISSLNVSVASGIMLYEVLRQRLGAVKE
ncbi:23S rRNA (guanosine(2251)-2'-O)-methyltransferase RlmB [Hymenobacter psychrophilus]|uniref:23S rRNA (Guanosine2251-2'-O)-methyltransferase n=1 Tax=Hymenobacter psychrophilus TaxID=651662 RepID=A0A1H3M8I6_9BACT|nr:23S rRNA (guanosine(2251)-2'-O)-methyltransferase RlmB [Hymenobacter psychrophilus]SDY72913.1 23S rRNA (guanosine2251-2'-O)-methyltransferase [Hymenobacter psychrophilus]